jgi:pyruvyltransferase
MRLYWFKNESNFGDALNPMIAASLISGGQKLSYARPSRCDSVFIGSTLSLFLNRFGIKGVHGFARKYLRPAVHVWGTGLINLDGETINDCQGATAGFIRRMRFHALRGRLTKDFVERMTGMDLSCLALGDPGLLASRLIEKPNGRTVSVGIIPHYVEYDDPDAFLAYERIRASVPDSKIIDVRKDPRSVLDEMAQCRTILSSAMHGLIVADSLHIPNARYRPEKLVGGGDFKFNDYYSIYKSFRGVSFSSADLQNIGGLETRIGEMYTADADEIEAIKETLIRAFPRR